MHILLFGGSFNPPHNGHLLLIKEAFKLISNLDELWLVPCYNHTFLKDLAPAADRLAMCELLVKSIKRSSDQAIKVNSIEIDHHTNGSTWKTLQLLNSLYPKSYALSPSFLMGSDQLPTFHKWQHYQDLLQAMTFYVYPRIGYPLKPIYPHMIPLQATNVSDVSSTLVREKLLKHAPLTSLLPQSIIEFIQSHHLYR
jgi:nicotinate-nucleotide adenylyltransferase